MIINSLCNTCLQPFQLLVEVPEVHLLKQISDEKGHTCPCPRLCGGSINLIGDPTIAAMAKDARLKAPMLLSGKQLYQAVCGLGLPDEVPKTVDTVDSFLRGNPIVKIVSEEISGSVYLHELHLQNGLVMHLGSGTRGAQVLKITKGAPHA